MSSANRRKSKENQNQVGYDPLEPRKLLDAKVVEVIVGSSLWTEEYSSAVERQGQGSLGGLNLISSGHRDQPLTASGLDFIRFQFDKDVDIQSDDLILNAANEEFQLQGFAYDSELNVATWELDGSVGADRLVASLNPAIRAVDSGLLIDGRSNRNMDADGVGFHFQIEVLPGDLNEDGLVTGADTFPISENFFSFHSNSDFAYQYDTNGDGLVTGADTFVVGDNFFARLPNQTPKLGQFMPVVSGPSSVVVAEDSGEHRFHVSIVDGTNSVADIDVSVVSSNSQVVKDDSIRLQSTENGYDVFFESELDAYGEFGFDIEVTNEAGTASLVVPARVTPVNDAPYVISDPGGIDLDDDAPARELNLDDLFGDVDDASLRFEIEVPANDILQAELLGSQLRLRGLVDQTGEVAVLVRALDADGLQAELPLEVRVERVGVQSLENDLVSDQLLEFHGLNVVEFQTNVDSIDDLHVERIDSRLFGEGDISIKSLGNQRYQIQIQHASQEYGVTRLRVMHGKRVVAAPVVMVQPAADVALADAGDPIYKVDTFELPDGGVRLEKTVNTKLISTMVARGHLRFNESMSLVRMQDSQTEALNASLPDFYEFTNEQNIDAKGNSLLITGVNLKRNFFESTEASIQSGIDEYIRDLSSYDLNVYATETDEWFDYQNVFDENVDDFINKSRFSIRELLQDSLSEINWNRISSVVIGNSPGAEDYGQLLYDGLSLAVAESDLVQQRVKIATHWAMIRVGNVLLRSPLPGTFKAQIGASMIWNARGIVQSGQDSIETVKGIPLHISNIVLNPVVQDNIIKPIGDGLDNLRKMTSDAYDRFNELFSDFVIETAGRSIQHLKNVYTTDVRKEVYLRVLGTGLSPIQPVASSVSDFDGGIDVQFQFPKLENPFDVGEVYDEILERTVPKSIDTDENVSSYDEASGINGKSAVESDEDSEFIDGVKNVYSIATGIASLIDGIGDIFGDAGGSSGSYTDHDGNTYNYRANQNRQGTAGRDRINTGVGNDRVNAYGGNDRIFTNDGADTIDAGHGLNHILSGKGRDRVTDGNGASIISTGAGNDVVRPGGGGDLLELGTGFDTIIFGDPNNSQYPTYDNRNIGSNLLVDPSKSGRIEFRAHHISEISFRKDLNSLEILLPGSAEGKFDNSIRFKGFFENDAAGWVLVDQSGDEFSLYALTGRITSVEVLTAAFGARSSFDQVALPTHFRILESVSTSSGRTRIHIAEDTRVPGLRSRLILLEGDGSIDGFLERNEIGGLVEANRVLESLASMELDNLDSLAIIGVGEAGLASQWVATALGTQVGFVNAYQVNAPDVSGIISQAVRTEVLVNDQPANQAFPEYTNGVASVASNFLVEPNDWASKIGFWSGNELAYGNWKAFSFEPLSDKVGINSLDRIRRAHDPGMPSFDDLILEKLDYATVSGHVSFNQIEDMLETFIQQGDGQSATTYNAVDILSPKPVTFDGSSLRATEQPRIDFSAYLASDTLAPEPGSSFSVQLDFQTAKQQFEHTAPGHVPVNESTLFNPGSTDELTYGWTQIQTGIKEGLNTGRASSLERDFVLVQNNTFVIEVPNPGIYNVSITFGDRGNIRESTQVFIDGFQADRLSTMPGDFLTRNFQISTLDSLLEITFIDRGGQTDYSAINGITVEHVGFRSPLAESEQLEQDNSLIIMAGSYELPESNAVIDTLEDVLKAAAMAAATALLPGIGAGLTGLAGSLGLASAGAVASTSTSVLGAVAVGVKKAVVKSLVTSIPKNFIKDPRAQGFLGGTVALFQGGAGALDGNFFHEGTLSLSKSLKKIDSSVKAAKGALTVTKSALALGTDSTEPPVDLWVYDTAAALAKMSQQFRLGRIDPAFAAIDLPQVIQSLNDGHSGRKLLRKVWPGSRDFLVLDWVPEGLELTDVSSSRHAGLVSQSARAIKGLVTAYVEELRKESEAELDLLLIGHGAGYDVMREALSRLNTSEIAEFLDYVKLVSLDPVSFSQKSGGFYHPELTAILDHVDNYFQDEDTNAGSLTHIGRPLDDRIGGSRVGQYNRIARVFDLAAEKELLRYRHWSLEDSKLTSAELSDIEFSPDGDLVATSGKDGIVSVRYTKDIYSDGGILLHYAGKEKFRVWGQDSKVRSLAFMEMEVDGEFKPFLLTISAANNPENTSIAKNKILLTDVETGQPVWQGRDIAGTQVEASPSGNVIVSSDANGNVKVWRRAGNTLTFDKVGQIVDAHPGGAYVADIVVINDLYFVTGGLNDKLKLFKIDDVDGANQVQVVDFNNQGQGKVRNLDYDPVNGILAVGSGRELSLWRFDQAQGRLTSLRPLNLPNSTQFQRQDHIKPIQGVAFSKPSFLVTKDGRFLGDRQLLDGTEIPRTDLGDIDIVALRELLDNRQINSLQGLKLVTGGEDRTIFLYSLDNLEEGEVEETSVLSGSMLPIRELSLSADGSRVAVVGQDNVDDDAGGPVKDVNLTKALDDRLGWQFSEIFLQARREHNAVPFEYIYSTVEEAGESYFWLRNSNNSNRFEELDLAYRQDLPPFKRDRLPGIDVEPIVVDVRPGSRTEVKPIRFLIEVDKSDFNIDTDSLILGEVRDVDNNEIVIGTIRQKRVDGELRPNVLIFEAAEDLDFGAYGTSVFRGVLTVKMVGPDDLDGNPREVETTIELLVVNHAPVLYSDTLELHPGRSVDDFRPKANDYDFDNDEFQLFGFPTTWQQLSLDGTSIARYRKNPNLTNGIQFEVVADTATVERLLDEKDVPYLSFEVAYQTRETKYKTISSGIIELQVDLQRGPENVTYSELGADLVLIEWEPVSWNADKYVIQRFDSPTGEWVKHAENAEVTGRDSRQKRIAVEPNTEYWIRVVAVNEKRREPSFGGDDVGGLNFTTPGYVAPESVDGESLGAAKVEIRWQKVYWDVNNYEVNLYLPLRDSQGDFVLDEDGNYLPDGDAVKSPKIVSGSDVPSAIFKGLESGTAYLAIVTAKNASKNVFLSTTATLPVFTAEKDLVSGINLERIGPKKIRVTWGTVSFAQRYRIVAIDPERPLDAATRVIQAFAPTSGNANSGVLAGLDPEVEYVVTVEAKDRNDNWVSILSTTSPPIVVPNESVGEGNSQIDGLDQGDTEYLLGTGFNQLVRLPSISGLLTGTSFHLISLSRNDVTVAAHTGEQVYGVNGLWANDTVLPSSVGNETTGTDGILVYEFQRTSDGWRVILGDNTTELRYVKTPDYLAAEEDTLRQDAEDSLPRQPRIRWVSPFWAVDRHILTAFDAVIDSETGLPQKDSDGKYLRGDQVGRKVKEYSSGSDKFFSHQFAGFTPDTYYIIELKTVGTTTVFEEIDILTLGQTAPTGVSADNITLDSFTARWTQVGWNTGKYRVVLYRLNAEGERIADSEIILNVGKDSSSKPIENLISGAKYEFSVGAYVTKNDTWVQSDFKIATIKTADDLSIIGLEVDDERNKQIDFKWTQLDFERERLYFELKKENGDWYEPANNGVAQGKTRKTLEGLPLNTSFDVRLVAEVLEFDGTGYQTNQVYSDVIQAKTNWGIDEVKDPTVSTARLVFPRFAEADKYQVVVKDLDGVVVFDRDFNQNSDNPRRVDLRDLPMNSTLSVTVSGLRSNGDVILTTDPAEFTTADAQPARPEIDDTLTGRQKFTIKFTPPTTSAHFSGYRIRVRESATGEFYPVKNSFGTPGNNLDKDRGQFEVTTIVKNGNERDLDRNQLYFIEVFAIYDTGDVLIPLETLLQVTTKDLEAPTDLSVTELGHTSLRVNWAYSTELREPRYFRIRSTTDDLTQVSPEDASWVVRRNQVGVDKRTALVEGLSPGIRYYIQVRAVYRTIELDNEFLSADTEFGPVHTTAADPVQDLRTTDVGKQQIDLRWDSPVWTPVAQYIEVKHGTTDWIRPEGSGVQVDRNYNTISKLIPNTVYQVRHVAVIKDQDGNDLLVPSQPISVQTDAYPPVPGFSIDRVTSRSARGNWGRLSEGGATKYRLRVYLEGSNNDAVAYRDFDPNIRQATMSGLEAATNYQMEVQAIKDDIVISSTGRQSFTTAMQAQAPQNVDLQRSKWKELTVKWTKPSNWNPSDYQVRLYLTTGALHQTLSAGANATEKSFTDLAVGTSYYAIVTARGSEGDIPSNRSSNLSTYARTDPTSFRVAQTGSQMNFTWNHFFVPGLQNHNFKYRVERKGGDGTWKKVNNNPISGTVGATNQSFNIQRSNSANPLKKGTTYQFRVVAVYNNNLTYSLEFTWKVL